MVGRPTATQSATTTRQATRSFGAANTVPAARGIPLPGAPKTGKIPPGDWGPGDRHDLTDVQLQPLDGGVEILLIIRQRRREWGRRIADVRFREKLFVLYICAHH